MLLEAGATMALPDNRLDAATALEEADSGALRALQKIFDQLSRSPVHDVLPDVVRVAAILANAHAAAVVRSNGERLEVVTYPAFEPALDPVSRHLFAAATDSRRPVRTTVTLELSGGRCHLAFCVPLLARRWVHGAICVYRNQALAFSRQHEDLLSLLGTQLALALENENLAGEVRRQGLALHGLHRIGKDLASHQDSQQLLRTIAETALDVLGADFVVLYEYLKNEDDVRVPPIYFGPLRNPGVLEQKGAVVSHRKSTVFKLLRAQEPFYAGDALSNWQEFGSGPQRGKTSQSFLVREGVVSSAGLPLVLDEEVLGVLFVNYRTRQTFGPEQRERIEIFASQAAQAISLAQRMEQSRRHVESLAALTEIGTALSSAVTLNVDAILDLVDREVARLLAARNLYVLFYSEERNHYTVPFRKEGDESLDSLTATQLRKTLAAYVIRTRRPLRVTVATYESLVQKREILRLGRPAKVWLGAPMVARGKILGAMAVQDYQSEEAYGQHDLNLLATLANQTAIAIDNARLLQGLQLDLLQKTGPESTSAEVIARYQDLHYVLAAILERAVQVLESDAGLVFLRDREPGTIRVAVTHRWPELQNRRLRFGQGLAGRVARARKPDFNNDYQRWPDRAPLFNGAEYQDRIGSVIAVPVIAHGELLGVMVLTSTPARGRLYSQEDLDRLEEFAGPVVIAVDTARSVSFQRALIDNSPYPVIGANTSGALTIFNAAAEKLMGYRRQEMLDRKAHDIYWNGMLEIVKIHRKLEREGGTIQIDSAVRSKNGERIPVLLSAAFLTDEQGSLGSITVLEDLRLGALHGKSARLLAAIDRIDHSSRELRELADTIVGEAIDLFDAEVGCLFLASGPRFRARTNRYAPHRPLKSLVIGRSSPLAKLALQNLTPCLLARSDPGELLPESRGTGLLIPIAADDEVHGLLLLESGKEDRFRFETEFLRVFAARCAAALRRVQLARSRRRIEEALIRSGGTLATAQVGTMVVHEIKNSLSNMFFTLEEIKQGTRGAKGLEKKFDVVDSELDRLTRLTKRLREFSRSGFEPHKSRAFLNDIVARTVEVLDSSIRRRRLIPELRLDPALGRPEAGQKGKPLLVDEGQISQVIINLTLNALEASQEGNKITFKTRLRGTRAEFQVSDTGRGLTKVQARTLFQPDFTAKSQGGGLGLLISKLIVENNHSGRISVASKPGKGTTVSVVLPVTAT
jgi:PAS domain S-box-containing protein